MTTTKTKKTTPPDFITPRQREILRWIEAFIAERGFAPTRREIMRGFGMASPNAVMSHLHPLKARGWLTWDEGSARTIRILRRGDA